MLSYNPPRYLFRRFEILRHVKAGENFLEVGTGNMKLAQALLNNYRHGTVIDFSEFVQAIHKSLPVETRSRLTLKVGDIATLDIEERFDCIVSCEVMEHIEDDAGFLRRLHALLNTGGQIILTVPSRMKYWSIHDEIVGHIRRYEKDEIIELFSKEGYTNIQVLSYGFPFVNLLRLPRIWLARKQYKRKKDWGQRKQTEDSGVHHATDSFNWLGILVNQYTFLLLFWIASAFNSFDLSDGYIVIAEKSHQTRT